VKERLLFPLVLVAAALACSKVAPTETAATPPFPRTPIPANIRIGSTATLDPLVEPPYLACYEQRHSMQSFTLYAEDLCVEEQCVSVGLEADVYAAWRSEMMRVFQLDESRFAERIQLADVSMMQAGSRVMVIMDYVVVNDWARTHQTDIVSFTEEPDAVMIAEQVRQSIFDETQINLPQVASIKMIEEQFSNCSPGLKINWCSLDYPTFGGRLYVTAFKVVDQEADKCMDAAVYVDTGELWYCRERPCMIDE